MKPVKLSVVIPLAPAEPTPTALLTKLAATPGFQVIVSAAEAAPEALPDRVDWLSGPAGRGRQLNRGAGVARNPWLWFVHADSVPGASTLTAVQRFVERNEQAIGYCDLRFLPDGPAAAALNAIAANWRSRLFGLPYGDQALCVPASAFESLGGFREDLSRGEDLDFVVRARNTGVRTRRIGTAIRTSARRYRERGWLRTTFAHQIAARRLIRNARHTGRIERA